MVLYTYTTFFFKAFTRYCHNTHIDPIVKTHPLTFLEVEIRASASFLSVITPDLARAAAVAAIFLEWASKSADFFW